VLVPAVPAAASPAAKKSSVTVLAEGLNNPRGVLLRPSGVVLVAEAGKGGEGPCVPSPEDPNAQVCVGLTGSVTAVLPPRERPHRVTHKGKSVKWRSVRVVEGLPSVAGEGGAQALGPHDLGFGLGGLLATIGLGGSPQTREQLGPEGRLLGTLVRLKLHDCRVPAKPVADLAAFEARVNPDGGAVDSNPYGLLGNWRGRAVVTDAGGNSVLPVDRKGRIKVLAVLPDTEVPGPGGGTVPMQAVPTTVVKGPDGALYIGQLTGFPFPPGGAKVFRLGADKQLTEFAAGFTNIVDIAFDRRGRLLVLEIAKDGLLNTPPGQLPVGALIRVERDGSRTEIAAGKLLAPGGVAVGDDGVLYVTNKSVLAGAGELLRIRP
jgi:hypothetical protein